MLFFDLEFYVPKEERNLQGNKGESRREGPLANPAHFILGGHFILKSLTSKDIENEKSFWLWNYKDEKELLIDIMKYFESEFNRQQNNHDNILQKRVQDIVTCGIGISRVDLPCLYIKSNQYQIAPKQKLFEIFLKTKCIELSNIAAFLFPKEPILYPKTANEITKKLFPKSKYKPSGKIVWDYYDNGDLNAISQRCEQEVKDIVKIYKKLQNLIRNE